VNLRAGAGKMWTLSTWARLQGDTQNVILDQIASGMFGIQIALCE
jgi:hypothetical protein